METELCRNTFDAVGGVDIFDACDLEASSGPLAGDYGRVCEEVFPNLVYKRRGFSRVGGEFKINLY